MSTSFGSQSRSYSPAFKRIWEAGKRFESRPAEPPPPAPEAESAPIRADALMRRWRVIHKLERAVISFNASRSDMAAICERVASANRVGVKNILKPGRARDTVKIRYEAMWRCRNELGASYPAIGKYFGCDHSTVIYGVRKHAKRLEAA